VKPYIPDADSVFTLKVTLLGTKPAVWRRLEVRDCLSLGDLHYILQFAMGWDNSHLHQYLSGKERYGVPSPDHDYSRRHNENEFSLSDLFKRKGAKLRYEYDFGDGWMHEIVLESRAPAGAGHTHPVCLGGARNCPPEDVGGIWGYGELLEAVSNPGHPRHRQFEEWLGETYDPDHFDLKGINEALGRMKYIA
jgi:hypothetical protein